MQDTKSVEKSIDHYLKTLKQEIPETEGKGKIEHSIDDIESVTKLLNSENFLYDMEMIQQQLKVEPKAWSGLVEQNPEYQLVVK